MLNKKFIKSPALALLFCLLIVQVYLSTPVLAQQSLARVEHGLLEKMTEELNREFIAGSISASEVAELALSKVDQVQTVLQNFIRDKELQCQDNFFVTACFDDLRLKRRQVQEVLKRINVEAKSFLRKARAAKLDAKIESKNAKEENSEEK